MAYALAGTVDIDRTREPVGTDINGESVYLRDIWPTQKEVSQVVAKSKMMLMLSLNTLKRKRENRLRHQLIVE